MKLCLGTYLKIIVHCSSYEQQDIVRKIMRYFDGEAEKYNDVKISKLVGGINNFSSKIRKMAQDVKEDEYEDVSKYFKEVIEMLDPNKKILLRSAICNVVLKDNTIENDTIVNVISGTKKIDLKSEDTDLASFLGGIFLYVMKHTKNKEKNEDSKKHVKEVEKYLDEIDLQIINQEKKSIKVQDEINQILCVGCEKELKNSTLCQILDKFSKNNSQVQEEIYSEAQRFCIEYEKYIEFLPLCQIANFVDPLHNNIRKQYTDYNKCSDRVKKKILELKGFKELDFTDENWIDRCIHLYKKKIEEMELATNDFLYEGAKYFHRAYERYSEYEIKFDPYIFDKIDKTETIDKLIGDKELKSSLGYYIADYLWYKKNHPEYEIIPPMDKLWNLCDLGACSEYNVTFWICKFIIESCHYIESSLGLDNEGNQDNEIELRKLSIGDSEELIERQEDMYYYALLQLYKCFYYQDN